MNSKLIITIIIVLLVGYFIYRLLRWMDTYESRKSKAIKRKYRERVLFVKNPKTRKKLSDIALRKHSAYTPRKDCGFKGRAHFIIETTPGWFVCKNCGWRNPKDF